MELNLADPQPARQCPAARKRPRMKSGPRRGKPARGPPPRSPPRAVTPRTRPPLVNVRSSSTRVPAWKTLTSPAETERERSSNPVMGKPGTIRIRVTARSHHHAPTAGRGSQSNSAWSSRPSMTASSTGNKSLRSRGSSTWVSGSPNRALHSSTFGPAAVRIRPGKKQALVANAVLAQPRHQRAHDFLMDAFLQFPGYGGDRRTDRAHSAGVRALAAFADALEVLRERQQSVRIAIQETRGASTPGRSGIPRQESSAPLLRSAPPSIISWITWAASLASAAMTTPLPIARPSALSTRG